MDRPIRLLLLSKHALNAGGVGEGLRQVCRRFPKHGVIPLLAGPVADTLDFEATTGAETRFVPFVPGFWKNPVAHFWAARKLIALAREKSIDIAHARATGTPALSARLLRDALGIPYVVTSHGDITPMFRKQRQWSRARTLRAGRQLAEADAVTHLNQGMYENAMLLADVSRNSVIIPNGCDFAWWQAPSSVSIPPAPRPYVLALGRLTAIKGLDLLIETHKELLDSGLDFSLVLAGDGEERQALERKAVSLGLPVVSSLEDLQAAPAPGVCFPGHITGDTKKAVVQDSLFLAHPNQTTEAFPLTFLEVMAAGKAIVCFSLPTFQGVVAEGENGHVIPVGEERAFREALAALLRDGEARRRYEAANAAKAAGFDWDVTTRKYAELYRMLVARNKNA